MSKAINLGKKPMEDVEVHSLSDLKDKTCYPTLYLGGIDDERLADLPDEGTCIIHYKVRRREHSETKREGEKPKRRHSIDMDVTSIEPTGAKQSYGNGAKKDSDGGARKAFNDYFDKK